MPLDYLQNNLILFHFLRISLLNIVYLVVSFSLRTLNIVLLSFHCAGSTLWHLQIFSQYIKNIIVEQILNQEKKSGNQKNQLAYQNIVAQHQMEQWGEEGVETTLLKINTGWCLSQQGGAPVLPHRGGAQQGLMGVGSPRGRGLVVPHVAGAQQGLKGCGLGWYPGELWDWLQAGIQHRWVLEIPVVMDPAAWPRSGYPGMVWARRPKMGILVVHGSGMA
jgi:hypothetical protein